MTYKFIEEVLRTSDTNVLALESAYRLLLLLGAKGNNLQTLIEKGCKKLVLNGFYMPVKSKEMLILIIQILRIIYGKNREEDVAAKEEVKKIIFKVMFDNIIHVELCCEGFLLLSVLIDEKNKEDRMGVSEIIKILMNEYKDNEKEMHKIAQATSHLPIEDLLNDKLE